MELIAQYVKEYQPKPAPQIPPLCCVVESEETDEVLGFTFTSVDIQSHVTEPMPIYGRGFSEPVNFARRETTQRSINITFSVSLSPESIQHFNAYKNLTFITQQFTAKGFVESINITYRNNDMNYEAEMKVIAHSVKLHTNKSLIES